MNKDEIILTIHHYITAHMVSARAARDDAAEGTPHRAMLAGKVKAYTDTLNFIETKYRRHLSVDFPAPTEPSSP
jgi:hypothetical protein